MNNDIEWKMVKLGDVATFLPTNTLSRDELNYSEGEYLDIHYGDVLIKFDSVTDVLDSDIPFVSGNKEFSQKSLLKNGDIVMADTAEDESVGKVTEVQNIGNCKVVSGLHTMCMRFQENLFAPNFAGYYFNSPSFHNLLLPYMHGTKVTSISKGDVKKVIFPIPYKNGTPDLETQSLIAQKLSDMDSLISAKEKLLAKKRNLKTAAMQKLIKDEESGNWRKVKLGDLISSANYGVGAEAIDFDGENKYLRITDIDDTTHKFIPNPLMSPSFYSDRYFVQKDDLLIARTGASVGKTYLYNEADGKLIYAGFLMKLHISKAVAKFVFYQTLTEKYNQFILSESARTGQPGINLQQIKKFEINIPYNFDGTPDLDEQKRIATILSDMDSEIASIEKEITKLQNLKTAMMQKMFCFEEGEE